MFNSPRELGGIAREGEEGKGDGGETDARADEGATRGKRDDHQVFRLGDFSDGVFFLG